ncbi:LLM class F420-dependent oxidoreductase [Mycolicibacterium sp. P9-64]|uniref:LLM class F420-dependent oxidoreductase n=1 Tax=Mycolicibacterium sp. P9-64 TaxID=2024612 RepID=UPI0011EC1CD8|nr:LLM class F420-dependent oxidoreductase [Mycolicibacterium sp. P9-64]KAA0086439.1 LLM class F420-dependent oxidoreductase [Mycolicibacterium sp. P9-64]
MTRPIRIAVALPPGNTPDYSSWRSAVLEAEELGTDLIFGWDHFHRPEMAELNEGVPVLAEVQPDVTNFEGWTALASWGEITHRAQIGLLVTGIGYRNPDLLADMARTVDHISGGRLVLGLGAGWYEKDYTTYGYDFGSWKSRFDLFEEGLARIKARFGELIPPPVHDIPILIGGTGPKRTLPLVVQYADIWHTFLGVAAFTTATAQLDEMAAAAGRDGSEIERSVHWFGLESAEDYRSAGASVFVHEIAPDPITGYDFSTVKEMLAWRDQHNDV